MGTRGRKSGQDLATQAQKPVERSERPAPPVELNSEQCEVWWQIINAYPADQFGGGQLGMLADLCKHTVTQRRVGQLLDMAINVEGEDFDYKHFKALLADQREESSAKVKIARALGIAQKSVYEPKGSGGGGGKAPWQ